MVYKRLSLLFLLSVSFLACSQDIEPAVQRSVQELLPFEAFDLFGEGAPFRAFYESLSEKEKEECRKLNDEIRMTLEKTIDKVADITQRNEGLKTKYKSHSKAPHMTFSLGLSTEVQKQSGTSFELDELLKSAQFKAFYKSLTADEQQQLKQALQEANGICKEAAEEIKSLFEQHRSLRSKIKDDLFVTFTMGTPTATASQTVKV